MIGEKRDDPNGLMPVWDALVAIYHEIKKICDRHGLCYYMSDGNALGAMRHGGFIPWDDDFDLTMPRPDYQRFIDYAQTELPRWLAFVDWRNTPEFAFYFGKVQVTDEERVRAVERQIDFQLSNGLFVDIFPLDGYPETRAGRLRLRVRKFALNQIMRFRSDTFSEQRGVMARAAWMLGGLLSLFVLRSRTVVDFRQIHERDFLRYPYETSKWVGRCCTACTVLCRPPMRKEDWGRPIWIEFYKGEKFPLPHDVTSTLENEYGDWRTLPSESERHPTHDYGFRCPWWLGPTRKGGVS